MPKLDTNAYNLPGHAARTKLGTLRRIRSDTEIGTLEKRYGVQFPARSDMEWRTFQDKFDVSSVKSALELIRKQNP